MRRVLLVCMGNICRSPLAEGLLRHHAALRNKAVFADSAGTYGGHSGDPPDARACTVGRAHGVDIGHLRARELTGEDFLAFDDILVADHANFRAAQALAPENARARLAYMLDAHPEVESGRLSRELPDPYYGGMRDFERVYTLLDTALGAWVAKL